MAMTRREAVAKHRAMWRWIGEQCLVQNRKIEKAEYPPIYSSKDVIRGNCYCCQYDHDGDYTGSYSKCSHCPIDWNVYADDGRCMCILRGSLYAKWSHERDPVKASEIAFKIANLPEADW